MEFAECNDNQKFVWLMVQNETNSYIGGLESIMMEYREDSKEYEEAKAKILNFKGIKEYIRAILFNSLEWCKIDNQHLVTREWVEERIDRRVRRSLMLTRKFLEMDITDLYYS